jgi:plasmid stabilization system protein ParE
MRVARYSPATAEDLIEIWLYISADNTRAADAFVDRLQDTCLFLAAFGGL